MVRTLTCSLAPCIALTWPPGASRCDWKALGDMDRQQAMQDYVELVRGLMPEWTPQGSEARRQGGSGMGPVFSCLAPAEDEEHLVSVCGLRMRVSLSRHSPQALSPTHSPTCIRVGGGHQRPLGGTVMHPHVRG